MHVAEILLERSSKKKDFIKFSDIFGWLQQLSMSSYLQRFRRQPCWDQGYPEEQSGNVSKTVNAKYKIQLNEFKYILSCFKAWNLVCLWFLVPERPIIHPTARQVALASQPYTSECRLMSRTRQSIPLKFHRSRMRSDQVAVLWWCKLWIEGIITMVSDLSTSVVVVLAANFRPCFNRYIKSILLFNRNIQKSLLAVAFSSSQGLNDIFEKTR